MIKTVTTSASSIRVQGTNTTIISGVTPREITQFLHFCFHCSNGSNQIIAIINIMPDKYLGRFILVTDYTM
jgi:hypothetical protein